MITKGTFKDGHQGWKVRSFDVKYTAKPAYEVIYSDDGECVAEFVAKGADAKLIAAAPDMKKQLEQFAMLNENHHDFRSIAGLIINARQILTQLDN